jgi:hypothetical protein
MFPHDERFEFVKLEFPNAWLNFTKGTGGTFKSNGKMKLEPGHSLAKKFPEKVATKEEMAEREAKMKAKEMGGKPKVQISTNLTDAEIQAAKDRDAKSKPKTTMGLIAKEVARRKEAEAKESRERFEKDKDVILGGGNTARVVSSGGKVKGAASAGFSEGTVSIPIYNRNTGKREGVEVKGHVKGDYFVATDKSRLGQITHLPTGLLVGRSKSPTGGRKAINEIIDSKIDVELIAKGDRAEAIRLRDLSAKYEK